MKGEEIVKRRNIAFRAKSLVLAAAMLSSMAVQGALPAYASQISEQEQVQTEQQEQASEQEQVQTEQGLADGRDWVEQEQRHCPKLEHFTYKIECVDRTSGKWFSRFVTLKGYAGDTAEIRAPKLRKYRLVTDEVVEVVLGERYDEPIAFEYVRDNCWGQQCKTKFTYKVRCIDRTSGKWFSRFVTLRGRCGDTVQVEAPVIRKYRLVSDEFVDVVLGEKLYEPIIFEYVREAEKEKTACVTVRFLDKESGKALAAEQKTEEKVGETLTLQPQEIKGYDAPEAQTITVAENGNTVEFLYSRQKSLEVLRKEAANRIFNLEKLTEEEKTAFSLRLDAAKTKEELDAIVNEAQALNDSRS